MPCQPASAPSAWPLGAGWAQHGRKGRSRRGTAGGGRRGRLGRADPARDACRVPAGAGADGRGPRAAMLGWFMGNEASAHYEAEGFVDSNSTSLPAAARERAVADVLRANPRAWRAWLESGSREDWSARIGTLRTPALIVAGADDGDLGLTAQRRLMRRTSPRMSWQRWMV